MNKFFSTLSALLCAGTVMATAACSSTPDIIIDPDVTPYNMTITYISKQVGNAQDVPAVLDAAGAKYYVVEQVNWPDYPYCPDVKCRIAYTDNALLVHYHVTEDGVCAKYSNDGDPVYKDSCMEFFFMPASDSLYYNFECSCIGKLLMQVGTGRGDRQEASAEVLATIQRWSSLGTEPFGVREGEQSWELALVIPFTALFKHQITTFRGVTARGNVYKCGTEPTKHYVSWNPIDLPKPDFHCPDFFGQLNFE